MKVVLLQSVGKVGRAGEVREVADGYARNYLLPKGLAVAATPGAVKKAQDGLRRQEQQQLRFAEELSAFAHQLDGMTLTFKAKVMEGSRIYGSIRDVQIAEEVTRLTGADIDRTKIELDEPLRELGTFELAVRLGRDLAPKIRVVISGEE